LVQQNNLDREVESHDGQFEIIGLENLLNLGGITLHLKDCIKVGQYSHVSIKIK
jgi:hypothetical protein